MPSERICKTCCFTQAVSHNIQQRRQRRRPRHRQWLDDGVCARFKSALWTGWKFPTFKVVLDSDKIPNEEFQHPSFQLLPPSDPVPCLTLSFPAQPFIRPHPSSVHCQTTGIPSWCLSFFLL